MKRKLIIHIGMGKTGSTSIQRTLNRGHNVLKNAGVHYLGLMLENAPNSKFYPWQVDSGWATYLQTENGTANEQLASALMEIDQQLPADIHTLVWSNESLFDSPNRVRGAIEAVIDRFEIEIVGYIRRPDTWITSAYLQWGIKHKTYDGPLKPFRNWAKTMKYVVTPKIEIWEALSGSVKFFNFDAVEDISQHFIAGYLPQVVGEMVPLRANETPSSVAMAMFAYYNSLSEGQVLPNELEPLLNLSGVLSKQQPVRAYNNLLPDEKDIGSYLEENQSEITQVNAFFDSHGEPTFDLSVPKVKDHATNQHEINRALLQMIKHLSLEVNALKKKLAGVRADND
tara:strand:+ start:3112 stop:4134 length:1023 start_codon:yes stop_codon:yes gene_type:complete